MGNDDLFKRRKKERIKRKENIRKLNPSKWLIICEGEKTEPNYFKKAGLNYKYHKNDEEIYFKLCKYGSLENAIEYAQKIFLSKQNQNPSQTESCTTVYNFFLQVEEAIEELNK